MNRSVFFLFFMALLSCGNAKEAVPNTSENSQELELVVNQGGCPEAGTCSF